MTFFDITILVAIMYRIHNIDFSEFNVIIYDKYIDHVITQKWIEIPSCFDCKVLEFDIDFELKRICIKSEEVSHE